MRIKPILMLALAALTGLLLVIAAVLLARIASGTPVEEDTGTMTGENLTGCSLLFVGDSLTAGYGFSDYSMTWCGMLETDYGMHITCCSVSGSTIASGAQSKDAMCTRTLPAGSFDIVFLEGGGNDWGRNIPVGSDAGSRDPDTVTGGLNVLIDRVRAAYPEALVVFMVPWGDPAQLNALSLSCSDYNAAAVQVCEARSIPYFRGDRYEVSGIDASDEGFRETYFLSSSDFWHLNRDGHLLFLPKIAAWLLQCRNTYAGS